MDAVLAEHAQRQHVLLASEACARAIGVSFGARWLECVHQRLLDAQAAAQREGRRGYFALEPSLLRPWRPLPQHAKRERPEARSSNDLKQMLSAIACDADGGGSLPVRTTWMEVETADQCEAQRELGEFIYKPGRLLGGVELKNLSMSTSQEKALVLCFSEPACSGFSYQLHAVRGSGARPFDAAVNAAIDPPANDAKGYARFYSWSVGEGADGAISYKPRRDIQVELGQGWHSFKRRAQALSCRSSPSVKRTVQSLRVDVLQEHPPVYLVHSMLSARECALLMQSSARRLRPALVQGHAQDPSLLGRRAYAANLRPDAEDEALLVTQVWRRLLQLARWAGYTNVSPAGSFVLANLYRDRGDFYGPHCDGECEGRPYRPGERVATSLTYCEVARKGGATLFTRSGLRVKAQPGQTLFFGYRLRNESSGEIYMDNGWTEHCGCPIRDGQKWVASMFYTDMAS